ncbi:MAG TPA: FMN-binding protein [Candidatus Sulfomarinibacteraceae bacterium]|nr:FMN-binding protein [Candidatus Sulfomarinibacteraceae bacterium]
MRSSVISSDAARRRLLAAVAGVLIWSVAWGTVRAAVLITVEEALELAFPGAELTRETLFLTAEQLRTAADTAELDIASSMATRFVARRDGQTVGFGYVDTHRVRTLPQTLVVILDPAGAVVRVEVAAFREPLEYMPGDGWYRQFDGEELDRDLALDREIRPVTGATLTARATTDAVRRVLAIHHAVTAGEAAP